MTKKLLFLGGVLFAINFFAAAAAQAAVPNLSQYSVTVGLGQSLTVNAQGVNGVYMLTNSAPTIASISVNGLQVTVTGNGIGSTVASICSVGTASDCTSLSVNVQAGSVSLPTFSPNSLSLAAGNSQNAIVSGGNGSYNISANTNSNVATASLASSTLTVTAVTAGTTAITVCDQTPSCTTLNVTVGASGSSSSSVASGATNNQYVNFSVANPTVAAGQTQNITLSPGYMAGSVSGYIIFNNANPAIVQAAVNNTTLLSLTGVAAGSDLLTLCAQGTGCNTITVTVSGTATSAPTQAQTTAPTVVTPTVQPTAVAVPVAATTGGTALNASLIAAIQSLQNTMAQLVSQIQSLQSQLVQAIAQASASGAAGTGASVSSAAAGSKYIFTEFLTLGTQDAEVSALQTQLTKLGYYSGAVTGYFGPATEAAVKQYQTAHNLSPLGYVGTGTRAALNAGN